MVEEFEGNVPDIRIISDFTYFAYRCNDTEQILRTSCAIRTPLSDKCFGCIGMNVRFSKYFTDNRRCSCGHPIDFGYFILIYFLERAELLPKDFKMECCVCKGRKVEEKWAEENL